MVFAATLKANLNMHSLAFILIVAYLLGSIPFGLLLVKTVRGQDVRKQGSGNIGATNVLRTGSKGLAILTLLLDMGKGIAAVLIASALAGGQMDAAVLAALLAIVGHVFPVWLRFRGGKGVATAFGAFLALNVWMALASFIVFMIVVLLTRYVSLASIAGAISFPVLVLLVRPAAQSLLFEIVVCCCAALIVLRHQKNISRLIHGVEYRFGKTGPRTQ